MSHSVSEAGETSGARPESTALFVSGNKLPVPGKKTIVLALGNDILTDDAVGLHVASEIRDRLAADSSIDVVQTTEMGLALLDFIVGYENLVLVDSIQTRQAAPGFLHELQADGLVTFRSVSPHFLGVGETLALGRKLGLAVPQNVTVFAIEVEDPFTISTDLTPAVKAAIPAIIERIMAELQKTR